MPRPQIIHQTLNSRRKKTTPKHTNKTPTKPKQQNTTNKTTLHHKKTLTHPLTKQPNHSHKTPIKTPNINHLNITQKRRPFAILGGYTKQPLHQKPQKTNTHKHQQHTTTN